MSGIIVKSIRKEDVGKPFINEEDGEIFKVISYTDHPTCTLQNIRTGETVDGVVTSMNMVKFKRLVVEN